MSDKQKTNPSKHSRAAANNLYRSGDLVAARTMYAACMAAEEGCSVPDALELARLHNNLSVCCFALGEQGPALMHARTCLSLDPAHGRAHLRIAKLKEDPDGAHLLAAAALLGSGNAEAIRALVAQDWDTRRITLVDTAAALRRSCQLSGVVVLRPGRYMLTDLPLEVGPYLKMRFIGLGEVVLIKGSKHALAVFEETDLQVENVAIEESCLHPLQAAVGAIGKGTQLTLTSCRFSGAGGVTVGFEASAQITKCAFVEMSVAGVEVNTGGRVKVVRSEFHHCSRAINAHAGARELNLLDCRFTDTEQEALNLDGAFPSAAARAVDEHGRNKRNLAVIAREGTTAARKAKKALLQAAEISNKAAQQQRSVGLLTVRVERCSFIGGKMNAVVCGDGARVELVACVIEDTHGRNPVLEQNLRDSLSAQGVTDAMYQGVKAMFLSCDGVRPLEAGGVHVRGGASVRVSHCALLGNDTGVGIDFNFDGDVLVEHCVCYNNKRDVVECKADPSTQMWSKPARVVQLSKVGSRAEIPTMSALSDLELADDELRGLVPRPSPREEKLLPPASPSRQPLHIVEHNHY